ncbi:hypothetical protein BDV97DRAFT_351653 [Delphinella strobiligena]|nr:hypothetical protein BDV97DRAFT_351653 [Delphinella strobiligena]
MAPLLASHKIITLIATTTLYGAARFTAKALLSHNFPSPDRKVQNDWIIGLKGNVRTLNHGERILGYWAFLFKFSYRI